MSTNMLSRSSARAFVPRKVAVLAALRLPVQVAWITTNDRMDSDRPASGSLPETVLAANTNQIPPITDCGAGGPQNLIAISPAAIRLTRGALSLSSGRSRIRGTRMARTVIRRAAEASPDPAFDQDSSAPSLAQLTSATVSGRVFLVNPRGCRAAESVVPISLRESALAPAQELP